MLWSLISGWVVMPVTLIGGNESPAFDGRAANLLLREIMTRTQLKSVPAQSITHA